MSAISSKNSMIIFVRSGCFKKETSEELIMGWVGSLIGKSSSIAKEVIIIRIFLHRLNTTGMRVYIPPVPKVADDYVPNIFSDMKMNKIIMQADKITMTNRQTNPNIQL